MARGFSCIQIFNVRFYIFHFPRYVRWIFWIILLSPLDLNFDMGLVSERLTDVIGVGSWFDSFTVKNTAWLSLVRKIITTVNSDSVLCGTFGLYPSYVADILVQAVSNEECTFSNVSCDKNYFKLSSNGETVILKFEIRILEGNLSSVLTFTYDLIRNSHLSTLAFAIVCVNNRITYVSNEFLASKHDCMYGLYETYSGWLKYVFYKYFDYLKKKYQNA